MVTEFVLLVIGAYLLGSVPAAYLVARWSRGIDIRRVGSGNVGAANVLSAGSKRLAVPVAIFDVGKGALMVWVAQLLGLGAAQQVTVGVLAIIGHNWSVFLRFRGGRGVFTSLGVITILCPWLGLMIFVLAYSLAPFRQVALGVLLAYISLPFFSWFLCVPLGIEERLPIMLGMVAIATIGIFRRIIVPKTPLSASVSLGGLVINRILFDRDIRDRRTWISQGAPGADSDEESIDQQVY